MIEAGLFLALLILLGGSALLFIERHRRTRHGLTAEARSRIHVGWHAIMAHIAAGKPSRYRQAVIEADTLVDFALKKAGYPGATMGERLRAVPKGTFRDTNAVWAAHKVRNELVHELDKELLAAEAKQMVKNFEQALHDLGAL